VLQVTSLESRAPSLLVPRCRYRLKRVCSEPVQTLLSWLSCGRVARVSTGHSTAIFVTGCPRSGLSSGSLAANTTQTKARAIHWRIHGLGVASAQEIVCAFSPPPNNSSALPRFGHHAAGIAIAKCLQNGIDYGLISGTCASSTSIARPSRQSSW